MKIEHTGATRIDYFKDEDGYEYKRIAPKMDDFSWEKKGKSGFYFTILTTEVRDDLEEQFVSIITSVARSRYTRTRIDAD